MEIWVIYVLISTIFSGITSYIIKLSAYQDLNSKSLNLYMRISMLILAIIYFIFYGSFTELTIIFFLICLTRIFFAVNKGIIKIESLKYIDSSLFFPITQILMITNSFLIGLIFFQETLSKTELLALILGVIIILLLTNKSEIKTQKDFKKGIIFVIIFVTFIAISSSINKYISESNYNLALYLLVSNIIAVTYSFGLQKHEQKKLITSEIHFPKLNKHTKLKKEKIYGLLSGTLIFIGFLFILQAHKQGDFVLVTMIKSFSMFIPITLSIIFLDEKLTQKKLIAFILFSFFVYLVSF